MSALALRYAPDFNLAIAGTPVPRALRASVTRVELRSGLRAADRVDVSVADPLLRWQEDPLFKVGNELRLELGYLPDALQQVFVGEIVTLAANFPSTGAISLSVAAHDARHSLARGSKARWFAIAAPQGPTIPVPDIAVAGLLAAGHEMIPIFDPVAASLSAVLGFTSAVVSLTESGQVQRVVRHQAGESDLNFLQRISRENGWEFVVDHQGPLGGRLLRFSAPVASTQPVAHLEYGTASLLSFNPKRTTLGQVAAVAVRFFVPQLKTQFKASVGFDWERKELEISVAPSGGGAPGASGGVEAELAGLPVNQYTAGRALLGSLLERLNTHLTATATVIGDPSLRAGEVVELAKVGGFSGRYRIVDATHRINASGYQTSLSLRREVWFDLPSPTLSAGPIGGSAI